MFKLIHNNMVVDLLEEKVCYVRYLPRSKRLIVTDSQSANGVRGSDNDTVYHLQGTVSTFPEEKVSVQVIEITPEEYEVLANQFAIQAKENNDLRNRLNHVEEQLSTTNDLLKMVLQKLG